MTAESAATQELLEQARSGHAPAVDRLLERHRQRLRRMVAVRLEPAMKARADASDIVQEALAVAAARIPDYLREPKLPFYPWLRGIAWDKLIEHRRWHRDAQRRSVLREEPIEGDASEESVLELAQQLVTSATSPSRQLLQDELRSRVRSSLAELSATDREVLILRYLEQLKYAEIAAVLGTSEKAVRQRHTRALERLRDQLDQDLAEGNP